MIKTLLTAMTVALSVNTLVTAQTYVDGYFKKDGTYVQGYLRSDSNENRYDNRNSRSNGGTQRDEYSAPPAYNRSNPNYNTYEMPQKRCSKDAFGNVSCY